MKRNIDDFNGMSDFIISIVTVVAWVLIGTIVIIGYFTIETKGESIIISFVSMVFTIISSLGIIATISVYLWQKNDFINQNILKSKAIESIIKSECEKINLVIEQLIYCFTLIGDEKNEIDEINLRYNNYNYNYISVNHRIYNENYLFEIHNRYLNNFTQDGVAPYQIQMLILKTNALSDFLYTSATLNLNLYKKTNNAISIMKKTNHILDYLIRFNEITKNGNSREIINYAIIELGNISKDNEELLSSCKASS